MDEEKYSMTLEIILDAKYLSLLLLVNHSSVLCPHHLVSSVTFRFTGLLENLDLIPNSRF